MNKVQTTVLALALLPLTLVPACGCSGFTGGGDVVLMRGNDMLIECDNGGFVATLASGSLEGHYADDTGIGSNGGLAFTETVNDDGTLSLPQLGADPWTVLDVDTVTKNHADVACQMLLTRSWWTAPTTAVSSVIELADPADASHTLVLCPSSTLYLATADGAYAGTYELNNGQLAAVTSVDAQHPQQRAVGGTLEATGALVSASLAANGATVTWQATSDADGAAANFCATGVYAPTIVAGVAQE